MKTRFNRRAAVVALLFATGPAFGQGNQPGSYADQANTGTTDRSGGPERQGGTITSNTGNTATATTPAGTDPSLSPANRNPYNDPNYRSGAPGTSVSGQVPGSTDPRANTNRGTLGTSAPAETNGTTPGLSPGSTPGQAPAGNPGPVGNAQTPGQARTSGTTGAGGSGMGGAPGAISDSGTHGINGSGH
jgi:hypothetical protein